jgi:hypothetical protein
MIWAQLLAYVTGTVDQELRLRNEYLAAENLWSAKKSVRLQNQQDTVSLCNVVT